jgi:hypothetical protein
VYKFNEVDVRTFAGVVQLSGFRELGRPEAARGGDCAANARVAQVVNNITLKRRQDRHRPGVSTRNGVPQKIDAPYYNPNTNKPPPPFGNSVNFARTTTETPFHGAPAFFVQPAGKPPGRSSRRLPLST